MSLSETSYLLFLAVAALLFWFFVAAGRRPLGLLVLLSLVFYGTWNVLYCLPLLITAATDFSIGLALERTAETTRRRLLVAVSLLVDLGMLGFFKYLGFFGVHSLPFRVVLMAGISFYTFQSLSYVLDVFQKNQEATHSFLEYLAFVSFFPTLLAGPITRAETLLPQLQRKPGSGFFANVDPDMFCEGFFLIALGFIKKCVIADYLADAIVNRVFDQPLFFSSAEVLTGVYAYAAQIYCDFSGYSDIAIGSALLLGIRLKDNFNSPYRSSDMAEFWRRWHISLSTWLRDYLYFSLPGNRRGSPMPYINLVITFALAGLWHGASWTFVIWGLLHGAGQAIHRGFSALWPARRPPRWRVIAGTLVTFHFVAFAWIFFRCDNLAQAGDLLRRLADLSTGTANISLPVVAATAAAILLQFAPDQWLTRLRIGFVAQPAFAQGLLLALCAMLVRWIGGAQVSPFIYQRF
jgi:alginate O-acetyltransferase complex protein AlgI